MLGAELQTKILQTLARLLRENKAGIVAANQKDIAECPTEDAVMFDRLKVDEKKVETMIASIEKVRRAPDPSGKILFSNAHEDGLRIENRTVPFGTILIIYEARPDVSVEAATICRKENIETWLVGGARNNFLVDALDGKIPCTKFKVQDSREFRS